MKEISITTHIFYDNKEFDIKSILLQHSEIARYSIETQRNQSNNVYLYLNKYDRRINGQVMSANIQGSVRETDLPQTRLVAGHSSANRILMSQASVSVNLLGRRLVLAVNKIDTNTGNKQLHTSICD